MEGATTWPLGQTELASAHHLPKLRYWLATADGFAAVVAAIVPSLVLLWRGGLGDHLLVVNVVAPTLVILLALVIAAVSGQYSDQRRLSRLHDVGTLAKALVIAFMVVTFLIYLTTGFLAGSTTPSRLAVLSGLLVFFVLGVAFRWSLAAYQRRLFAQGQLIQNVLLLGSGAAAQGFLEFLDNRPWLGVRCVGRVVCDERGADARTNVEKAAADVDGEQYPKIKLMPTVDSLQELHQALVGRRATEVVVALDPADSAALSEVTRLLTIAHVPFQVVPSLFEQTYRSAGLLGYLELPVIDVNIDPLDRVQRGLKRTLDVVGSVVLLLLGVVPLLLLMIIMKLDSPGPIFYRQERVGKNGRRFQMLKFRTMVPDAHEMLDDLRACDESGSDGKMFKMRADPRVTRVGRFLRKWSLDELPQVKNVFEGDMSLVGPRPPLPEEVDTYEEEHLYRLRGVPGITGLWQVSGRSDLDFEQMVRLDRYYLENWSVWLDFGIILKTMYVVATRKGAY